MPTWDYTLGRGFLFFLGLAAVISLVVNAIDLGLDKRANPELYGFRIGGEAAYQYAISPVVAYGGAFVIDITDPLILNLSFEDFEAGVQLQNDQANLHYREFISVKFYLIMLSVLVWLAIRMIDLEVDNARLSKKLKGEAR